MTTRDIVVAGALPRHQLRQYLNALGVEYDVIPGNRRHVISTFRIADPTEAQWGQIQEWVRKVTG